MFRVRTLATTALTASVARRFVKSTDPTYEDDRWLEAQFQDVEKTVEERYAFEKQKEVMKKLIEKMRSERTNDITKTIESIRSDGLEAESKRHQEIRAVDESAKELRNRVDDLASMYM